MNAASAQACPLLSRIMVGLPSVENRELILTTLLSKEKVEEGLDYKALATMTEGFSGSDLKVCRSLSASTSIFTVSLLTKNLCLGRTSALQQHTALLGS